MISGMGSEKKSYSIEYASPIGILKITANPKAITNISFVEEKSQKENPNEICQQAIQELEEYFAGKREQFTVPLQLQGTEFQQSVWQELQKIPFGRTLSYFDLSNRLGDVKAIRAVGTANGKNPIAIMIPCHRVVGKNGELRGYAGGLHRKEWLLNFEQQFEQKTLFDQ